MPSGWSRARCRVCLQLLRVESLTQGLCSSRVSTWRQGVWAGGLGWESGWPWGGRQGSRRLLCSSGGPPPPGSASRPLCSLVQFDCTNTLNDQTLENVTVQMEPTEAYEVLCYVPARSLPYNQPGTCYTLVALPKEDPTAGEPPRPPGSPWVGVGRAACAPAVCLPVRASAPRGLSRAEGRPARPGALHTAARFLLTHPSGQHCSLSLRGRLRWGEQLA